MRQRQAHAPTALRDALERAQNNNPQLATVVHRALGTRNGYVPAGVNHYRLSGKTRRQLDKNGSF